MYKPHPKQIEFFESEERYMFWDGAYPSRTAALIRKQLMPIDKPYAYHKPSEDDKRRIDLLREHFSFGERLIKEICPMSRHQSIALTNNEQTAMWAIKAVVFNDPQSEVE